jgi:hypothetical protein
MPVYSSIRRWMDSAEKARTAERLLALRQKLSSEITGRVGRDSLLIATWNLRDFDTNRLGHGPRLREAFYYIAEIISAFDLVTLQEVGRNLDALELLMGILGPEWDYFATAAVDVGGGREERMAFVFRQDKIRFRKIAGEIVLPAGLSAPARSGTADLLRSEQLQFVRAPFMAAFEAGTVRLNFCVLHLCHTRGAGDIAGQPAAALDALARFFRERQDKEREDYILIGDFGIATPAEMGKAMERHGFDIPEPLMKKRTHLAGGKFYDQIAFRIRKDRLEPGNAGTFRHFDAVFRDNDDDFAAYQDLMPETKANDLWNGGPRGYYTEQWRTWQISDHQPLWVELKVDFSDHYLDMIRKGGSA